MRDIGVDSLAIADTTGVGTPKQVVRAMEAALEFFEITQLSGHFHDTHGHALENIRACLLMGIGQFDASCAGLGGLSLCPRGQRKCRYRRCRVNARRAGHRHWNRPRQVDGGRGVHHSGNHPCRSVARRQGGCDVLLGKEPLPPKQTRALSSVRPFESSRWEPHENNSHLRHGCIALLLSNRHGTLCHVPTRTCGRKVAGGAALARSLLRIFKLAPGKQEEFIRGIARADEVAAAGGQLPYRCLCTRTGGLGHLTLQARSQRKADRRPEAAMAAKKPGVEYRIRARVFRQHSTDHRLSYRHQDLRTACRRPVARTVGCLASSTPRCLGGERATMSRVWTVTTRPHRVAVICLALAGYCCGDDPKFGIGRRAQ